MKASHLAVLAVLAGTLAYSNAHAGVYVETVTRDQPTGKEELLQRMYIQDGMARMESGARGIVTIFKNETLFSLDTAKKTYTAMDSATLERTMGAMNDMMQKMQAQLANMPAEQRAMMEKMMKQNGMPGASTQAPVAFDATPTSITEKVSGRTCKVWNITRNGAPNSQVCVVPYAQLPGKNEVQTLAKKMSGLLEKLPESLRNQNGGNPLDQNSGISAKLNGAPFITRNYRNGELDLKATVIKTWREQSVAAAQFEIPSDYSKQELPNLNPARGAK